MSRPVWLVKLIKLSFPGRFVGARATRLPLLGRLVERWLFEGDALLYLPRDGSLPPPKSQVIPLNQPIEPPDDLVLPSQVVAHFIRQANTHWIMNTCLCRDASGCQDYPIDLGCLFLGEAANGVNPKLGRPVSQEEALAHVERCRQAGLVHLIGRNKLDTVWLGVGPGDKLLTICNCCPCCCLWGMLPHLAPHIGAKVSRMPGVRVWVNEQCIGCGTCTQGVCFADAIHLVDGRAVIGEGCRGCGRCVDVCPQGEIDLTVEGGQFVEQTIAHIASLVDVS